MLLKYLKNVIKYRQYYTVSASNTLKKQTEMQKKLYKQLEMKIKLSGPISVAEYMKEVLTNPYAGYYMHKDVFGDKGDFITSPELGQLFGEMVAVWFISEWKKIGSPKPFQIIELGPGKGSLSQDILRIFKHFDEIKDLSLNLVEVSPYLSDLQARNLCLSSQITEISESSLCVREGLTASGVPVNWYNKIQDVPRQFSLIVAHEFFDALPIQKFQKTNNGWREILIDIDDDNNNKLKYVLANQDTLSSKILIKSDETRKHVEISKEAIKITKHLAQRLEEDGGIALIADYGHNGEGTDTFRAFKDHKLHDPLLEPGSADLTADVDFKLLKEVAESENQTITFGPIYQNKFLQSMGINIRIEQLLKNATDEQKKSLQFALDMMTDDNKMGKRFKLFSMFPEILRNHLKKFPVVGFS